MFETATRPARDAAVKDLKNLVDRLVASELDAEGIRLVFGSAGIAIDECSVQRIIRLRFER